jgi:hypothetical protein
MIEAVGVVVAPQAAEKLLALYASGLKAEAGKLTLGVIKETAESIKLSPKVVKWVQAEDARVRDFPYSPTEVAEKIRDGWLRWVAENEKPEVVQHFSARISNLGGKCVIMEWVPSAISEGAKGTFLPNLRSLSRAICQPIYCCGE